MKNYKYRRIEKTGKKGRKGQMKAVRNGSRHPGSSSGHGSIRRPY